MPKSLPPRAHLRQLKHQAKDLVRAHGKKIPAVLPVLRQLRQFANRSDDDVFAARFSLHEAQYALALEYGFTSWAALKERVEGDRAGGARVRRDGDVVVIAGLERETWGGAHRRQSSVIAALHVALAPALPSLRYSELMGFGGAAFRLQHKWCPSSPNALCGFDCTTEALRTLGWDARWFRGKDWQMATDSDGLMTLHQTAVESIDAGRAVLMSSEECSLIVGYADSGDWLIRRYATDAEGYERTNEMPWDVGVLVPGNAARDDRLEWVSALERAVMLANTPCFGEYASGFGAYERWASELEEDDRFASLEGGSFFGMALGNAHTLRSLADARLAAEEFVGSVVEQSPSGAGSELREAATAYGQAARAVLEPDDSAAEPDRLFPWMLGSPAAWTRASRLSQARSLRRALDAERQAVHHVERALRALAVPS
jgi:hypothetical protein